MAEVEREAITEAVKQLGVVPAAKALGISKTSIYRKQKEWQDKDTKAGIVELLIAPTTVEELRKARLKCPVCHTTLVRRSQQ